MKIGQYCQRQRCKHVELEQFWQAFASRGFVSDSWAFLFARGTAGNIVTNGPIQIYTRYLKRICPSVYGFVSSCKLFGCWAAGLLGGGGQMHPLHPLGYAYGWVCRRLSVCTECNSG